MDFIESRAAFEARPDFAELVAEAHARGYRRISLAEQRDCGSADAYMWRGGVWVPLASERSETARPLTLEFIEQHIGSDEGDRLAVIELVREVEAAHGIK